MNAWEGVDLADIRDAVGNRERLVHLELDRNLFGGEALIRVTSVDPFNPRRKAEKVLPGPLVGDSHASLLRALADVLDGTIESLTVTPREDNEAAS